MFSFRGHTPFDYLQYMAALLIGIGGTQVMHLPWQIVCPIALVVGLPAMSRVYNGIGEKQRKKQEALQDYFDKGGR